METKEPGYYRMLLENIEQMPAPAAPTEEADDMREADDMMEVELDEDRAQTIALAQGLKRDVDRALASQDPSERERLLHGVSNSMDDLIDAIRQGGMNEGAEKPSYYELGYDAWYGGSRQPDGLTPEQAKQWNDGWHAAERHERYKLDRSYDD